MNLRVVTSAERPLTDDDWQEAFQSVWADFLFHDAMVREHWDRLEEHFADYQLTLLEDERIVAIGNTIPFAWDGTVEGLPHGVTGVLPLAIRGFTDGVPPTTLCALQAIVRPDCQGRGLSTHVVQAMSDVASRNDLDCLVAPVRPTHKDRYPLAPMESYMRWTRDDGLPFDPWLRVHHRLGAKLLGVADGSIVISGTVAEWEDWTGMAFPESGDYVVPSALVPVQIDRVRDEGRYVEPNVWMRHDVAGGAR